MDGQLNKRAAAIALARAIEHVQRLETPNEIQAMRISNVLTDLEDALGLERGTLLHAAREHVESAS